MEFDKFTERSRGFIQAAQARAASLKHQELAPEHLLKVLLEDEEGLAANLMTEAGADPDLAAKAVEAELESRAKVEGPGAGQGHRHGSETRFCCRSGIDHRPRYGQRTSEPYDAHSNGRCRPKSGQRTGSRNRGAG